MVKLLNLQRPVCEFSNRRVAQCMGVCRCPQALLEGVNKLGYVWPTCRLKLI